MLQAQSAFGGLLSHTRQGHRRARVPLQEGIVLSLRGQSPEQEAWVCPQPKLSRADSGQHNPLSPPVYIFPSFPPSPSLSPFFALLIEIQLTTKRTAQGPLVPMPHVTVTRLRWRKFCPSRRTPSHRSSPSSTPKGDPCSDFCHLRSVLPAFKLHRSGNSQYLDVFASFFFNEV